MARVQLKQVAKIYEDGFKAVKNISLDIEDKEFIVFVGPSGCGKSTTLRMIAGLEPISEGELFIGDERVNNTPPKDRDIAMVFQSYALYPHMTVRDNMAFSMKMNGVSKKERYERVEEVSKTLQLDPLLDKKPGALSGGQRQRVALGRAMVREPKVFLLDEPLSNLDAKLRVAMRSEIVQLHRKLETTFIYVTHDQTEAMTMGTRIAVLNAGEIMQFDTPSNLYYNPANKFVAEFIGSPQMNMLDGHLVDSAEGPALQIANEVFPLGKLTNKLLVEADGREVHVGIRPEDLYYAERRESHDTIKAHVNMVEQVGADTFVYFDFHSAEKELSARFHPALPIPIGEEIFIKFDINKLFVFDKATEESLLDLRKEEGPLDDQ